VDPSPPKRDPDSLVRDPAFGPEYLRRVGDEARDIALVVAEQWAREVPPRSAAQGQLLAERLAPRLKQLPEERLAVLLRPLAEIFGLRVGELRGACGLQRVRTKRPDAVAQADPHAAEAGTHHCTKLGNARRLVASRGADYLYCARRKTVYTWNGTRWRPDHTDQLRRWVHELPAAILAEAARSQNGNRALMAQWGIKSEDTIVIDGTIKEALALRPVDPAELDADPYAFSFLNATVDLRSGEARPPRREDKITRGSDVGYQAAAPCPRWQRALEEWFADPEIPPFLARAAGVTMIGEHRDKVFFFLHGPAADNGKTVFTETLRRVFGAYAAQLETASLLESKYGQSPAGHRTDLLELRGARYVTAAETKEGGRLAEDAVKWLTGGDRLKARAAHAKEYEEWDPTHTLWVSGNYEPQLPQRSKVFNRLLSIPWLVSFPKGDPRRDPELADALRAELPGIAAWCVRGALAYQERGLDPPAAVLAATQRIEEEQDRLGGFLATCTRAFPGALVSATQLRDVYARWSGDDVTQKVFGRWMTLAGIERHRGVGGVFYKDLELLPEVDAGGARPGAPASSGYDPGPEPWYTGD